MKTKTASSKAVKVKDLKPARNPKGGGNPDQAVGNPPGSPAVQSISNAASKVAGR